MFRIFSYEPYVSDFVINLSHFKLGDDHLSALEKGLGFAPTTRELIMSLVASELEAFCRRLRLKEFFQDTPIPENDLNSAEKGFLKSFDYQASGPHLQDAISPWRRSYI